MTIYREIIYKGRNNTIDVILTSNGVAQSLSSVTHMELVVAGVTYSSSSTPAYFDWSGPTTGYVSISLGQSGVTPQSAMGKLIIYDTSHTNGILWGKIPLRIEG